MRSDEQIFSLMAIAEEQQRLITRYIEQQEASTQAMERSQRVFLQELQGKQQEVQREFDRNLFDLNQKLSSRIGWSSLFLTMIVTLFFAGTIAAGFAVYLREVQGELKDTRAVLRKLEGYNADLKICTTEAKEDFPCVRVMRSWGGFGEHKDYFILDPK
ncbi:hypothetical protein [Carnobacterium maltaromaticum]|jgi:hypothetical protein|uniref:hypothetical protein n=2 Tax=Carnobacterium maltaromaticum TaxID=2751 RepID=UPI000C7770FF|nr:hypothetical protein CYV28_15625 [Carnobacterium maltaromaticum]PLS41106.1 hypothetical protein CYV32_15895 [Carnobacterium maltaromaticum]